MPKSNCSTTTPELTVEWVWDNLRYDPLTGDLYWKARSQGRPTNRPAGSVDSKGYRRVLAFGTQQFSHRLAWVLSYGVWPKHDIDHINGVRDDNRLVNLRDTPRSANLQNQYRAHRDNATGFLGVSWCRRDKKFKAEIMVDGVVTRLGRFSDAETAHSAYLEAKRRLHEGNML